MSDNKIQIKETVNESMVDLVNYLFVILNGLLNGDDAEERREFVTIGLSGGSLIKQLSKELIEQRDRFRPMSDKLRIIFCDERFVPLDHEDSTYHGYVKERLFDELTIKRENVFAIKADSSSVDECAKEYEARLSSLLNKNGAFDVLLLGMGPDGHTCSLFPGHKLFVERDKRLVAPIDDSPKPPPARVTLTLEYINKSSHLIFCTFGDSKADIIRKILKENDQTLPSACVQPSTSYGSLKWFIDTPAAKLL